MLAPAELSNVVTLSASTAAYAALLSDGSVQCWGAAGYGNGGIRPVTNVVQVHSYEYGFLTISADGSASAWGGYIEGYAFSRCGDPIFCVPMPSNIRNIKSVIATKFAIALLLDDSTVLSFGRIGFGGDAPAGLTNVRNVYSNSVAFIAVKYSGEAIAWGDSDSLGSLPESLTNGGGVGVRDIFASNAAFAAGTFGWMVWFACVRLSVIRVRV